MALKPRQMRKNTPTSLARAALGSTTRTASKASHVSRWEEVVLGSALLRDLSPMPAGTSTRLSKGTAGISGSARNWSCPDGRSSLLASNANRGLQGAST